MNKSLVKYPYLTEDVEIYERENGHKIVLAHKETPHYLLKIFVCKQKMVPEVVLADSFCNNCLVSVIKNPSVLAPSRLKWVV